MYLKLLEYSFTDKKPDLENNALALKYDTQYKGNLPNNCNQHTAFIARTSANSLYISRTNPFRRIADNKTNPDSSTTSSSEHRPAREDNLHFGKTCYSLDGWNHISSNRWYANPKLYSQRLRAQQGNAYGTYC